MIAIHKKSALSFVPHTMGLLPVCISVCASSVHLSIFPQTIIQASIRPLESALPMPLVVEVISVVDPAIGPRILTMAIHVALVPLAHILTPVEPLICATALHLIIHPVS